MEPDTEAPTPPPSSTSRNAVHALARLRDRVEAAAAEIERLRQQNARLADRLARGDRSDGPALPASGDPAALRAQLQGFIDAVDRALDRAADS